MLRAALCLLAAFSLSLFACSKSSKNPDAGTPDAGGVVLPPEPDAGPTLHPPDLAESLGPDTGAYDVNGAGRLLVVEVDGRLGLELSDPQHLYLGSVDAGAFATETVFPSQESCGPATLNGHFDRDGGYQATETFCAAGSAASGPISGHRLTYPHVYRQNLAWSGTYDAVESPASDNTCSQVPASRPLKVGVARDRDGGAVTALLVGDGLREELVFGRVDDSTGILSANAVDATGQPTDGFTLYFTADGGVAGTRSLALGDGGTCAAKLQLVGAKR